MAKERITITIKVEKYEEVSIDGLFKRAYSELGAEIGRSFFNPHSNTHVTNVLVGDVTSELSIDYDWNLLITFEVDIEVWTPTDKKPDNFIVLPELGPFFGSSQIGRNIGRNK